MQKETKKSIKKGENHEMLAEALEGVYKSLSQNGGHLDLVTNEDIVRNSDIYPAALDYYYQNAQGVYKDVAGIIKQIFSDLEAAPDTFKEDERLLLFFEKLRKQPEVLRIILCISDFRIWEHGKGFFLSLMNAWEELNEKTKDYLFKNFCFQFLTVLERWEQDGFSQKSISSYVRLVKIWLSVDSMAGAAGRI